MARWPCAPSCAAVYHLADECQPATFSVSLAIWAEAARMSVRGLRQAIVQLQNAGRLVVVARPGRPSEYLGMRWTRKDRAA